MNKLRKYFNSLNLQNKLRLCFIFLILIPSVIIGVAYYGVSYHSIIDIAKKNILDVVVKNTQLIDRQMSYIQDSAVNLNVDQELYRLLSDVETVPDSELLVKDKKIPVSYTHLSVWKKKQYFVIMKKRTRRFCRIS